MEYTHLEEMFLFQNASITISIRTFSSSCVLLIYAVHPLLRLSLVVVLICLFIFWGKWICSFIFWGKWMFFDLFGDVNFFVYHFGEVDFFIYLLGM